MTTWLLIVLIYAGAYSHDNSVTMFSIPGWLSKESCEDAGPQLQPLVKGTTKEVRYVCLRQVHE